MTLDDGTTPGAMRHGAILINALIARGCRIVPDPLNKIPAEFNQYLLRLDEEDTPRLEKKGRAPKKKNGNATLL